MDQRHFIFRDRGGKRWRRFSRLIGILLIAAAIGGVLFIRALLTNPPLTRARAEYDLSKDLRPLPVEPDLPRKIELPPAWLARPKEKRGFHRYRAAPPVVLGYYVDWDSNSLRSLEAHADQLTHVAPEWLHLAGVPPRLHVHPSAALTAIAREKEVALMPLLTNLHGDAWQPEAVESLARAHLGVQRRFFHRLIGVLLQSGAAGVLIDWEGVDPTYERDLTTLLTRLGRALHRSKLQLWLSIPVGNDIKVFNLDQLASAVDRFVAMLYDETGEEDAPGPIASQPWFDEWLRVLLEHGTPSQWIIGLGTYGYDWQHEGGDAQTVSFIDSMARAGYSSEGGAKNAPPYTGPHFSYWEKQRQHTVWFLDAATFHNQRTTALKAGVAGIGMYRLGTEDPAVWEELHCGQACSTASFETIASAAVVAHVGDGDLMTAAGETSDGLRLVRAEADGMWSAAYQRYPKYPSLYHWGESRGDSLAALTFDDGPDGETTPQVLDILKRHGTPATFFVLGEKAAKYPNLLRRIVEEGHELGNHSYTHPDLSRSSPARVTMELNAAQRIIADITGYSTRLFRPPYNADRRPQTYDHFLPLLSAHDLGYIIVSQSVDSEDWDRSGPQQLRSRIISRRAEGNVILLHDGGGDRSRTIEALPLIIDYLQRRGDRLVTISQLGGLARDAVMPRAIVPPAAEEQVVAAAGLQILQVLQEAAGVFLIATAALVLLRTLILVALAAWQRWKAARRGPAPAGMEGAGVSVILPAHNEGKVIASTLEAILATRHPGPLEVIVIDDGSTDDTAEAVRCVAERDGRVVLLRQEKRGKGAALNNGLNSARYELLVMLDADTLFEPATIPNLLEPLADPAVTAVSGQAKVGNSASWIGRFQSLEYICGFNLDRRAYDVLNCITVVPGAVSAYRKNAVTAVGGIPEETLAEDTDLTYLLHRAGRRIRYAPDARAWTEAPSGVKALIRQRRRWAFGTLQCLWKHRGMLFRRRYKALAFFSMPSVWFFHFFLVALVPAVDLLLILSLLSGRAAGTIAMYALTFLVLDLITAAAACWIDREPIYRAWLILPMRLLYRPLLAWCVWCALLFAVRGAWVEWGKQERKGVAALPDPAPAAT